MELAEVFERLYALKGKAYSLHKTGLPDAVRQDIDSLCLLFEQASDEARLEITSHVASEISFLFLRFSESAALEGLHRSDRQLIVRGLEALAIENGSFDLRDSTMALALLYHSAERINGEPEVLIRSVSTLAMEPAKSRLFLSFLARTAENRGLIKFGLKEAIGPDGKVSFTSRFT